jgi:hypothetical protein
MKQLRFRIKNFYRADFACKLTFVVDTDSTARTACDIPKLNVFMITHILLSHSVSSYLQ